MAAKKPGPSQPTQRQKRFAANVVAGMSKAAAYAEAYPTAGNGGKKPSTIRHNAIRAAQSRAVQSEVARLEKLALPRYDDLVSIHRFAVDILLELARDAFKESERRQAAQYLEAYARSGLTLRIGEAVQGKDPDADLV